MQTSYMKAKKTSFVVNLSIAINGCKNIKETVIILILSVRLLIMKSALLLSKNKEIKAEMMVVIMEVVMVERKRVQLESSSLWL